MVRVAGILLAGGQSRRFGSPKAFALYDSIPFYQHSIHAMTPCVDAIVLVANDEIVDRFDVDFSTIHVITDHPKYKGLGPLAGIYSGMNAIKAEWYVILPIDVPFIEASIIERILDQKKAGHEAIVPVVNGRTQPLISAFHHSIKDKINEQLTNNELSPKQLFAKCDVAYVPIDDDRPFRNINYQEDLHRYSQEER